MSTTVKQDFARLTLGMFAASFPAYPLTFTYVGEAEAPQGKADVIDAKGPNNFTLRLFVNQQNHLPIMVSWQGRRLPGRGRGPGGPGMPGGRRRGAGRGRRGAAVSAARRRGAPPASGPGRRAGSAAASVRLQPTGVGRAHRPVTGCATTGWRARRHRARGAGPAGRRAGSPRHAAAENRLYFADYRDVDGMQFPFRLRRAVGPDTVEETTFDRFRINAKIDSKRFEVRK